MKNNRIPLLIIAAVAFAWQSCAQVSAEAQQVIDQYVTATGGAENKEAIESMVVVGEYEMPDQGITAKMTLYFKKPNKFLMAMDIPNVGELRNGFDGEKGWEMHPISGFRFIEDTELNQLKMQSDMFPELHIDRSYKSVQRGEDRTDGKIALELINVNDYGETWVFDPDTYYLVQTKSTVDAGVQGSFPITNDLSDYRPAGDIMMAYTTVTSNPAFTVIIRINEVKIDADVEDSLFEAPGAIQ